MHASSVQASISFIMYRFIAEKSGSEFRSWLNSRRLRLRRGAKENIKYFVPTMYLDWTILFSRCFCEERWKQHLGIFFVYKNVVKKFVTKLKNPAKYSTPHRIMDYYMLNHKQNEVHRLFVSAREYEIIQNEIQPKVKKVTAAKNKKMFVKPIIISSLFWLFSCGIVSHSNSFIDLCFCIVMCTALRREKWH